MDKARLLKMMNHSNDFLTLRPSITVLLLAVAIGTSACGTRKKDVRETVEKGDWDHERIREMRKAQENELSQPYDNGSERTLDCVILTATQKKRSKATGCRALDPKEGFGQNKYCCENEYGD